MSYTKLAEFLLLLLTIFYSQIIPKSDIFTPILPSCFAIADNGEIFLLDMRESTISIFQNGQLKRVFGCRGQGPGEFQRAGRMHLQGERLFVTDLGKIHAFDLEGNHETSWHLPEPFLIMYRVENGWFGHTLPYFSDEEVDFKWYNHKIRGGEVLFTVANAAGEKNTYSLVGPGPSALVDRTGRVAIIVEKEAFRIHFFEMATHRHLSTLEKKFKPLEFDRTWAKRRIAQIEKEDAGPSAIKAFQPEFFPEIREVYLSPENHLLIFRWAPNPYQPERLVFDLKGMPAHSAIQTMEGAKRILGVFKGQALVSTFVDEEAQIHVLPFTEVESFVAKNPIVFDMKSLLTSFQDP